MQFVGGRGDEEIRIEGAGQPAQHHRPVAARDENSDVGEAEVSEGIGLEPLPR
jgi:hypothetical protein